MEKLEKKLEELFVNEEDLPGKTIAVITTNVEGNMLIAFTDGTYTLFHASLQAYYGDEAETDIRCEVPYEWYLWKTLLINCGIITDEEWQEYKEDKANKRRKKEEKYEKEKYERTKEEYLKLKEIYEPEED